MDSNRLPGKVMKKIDDEKTLLEYVISQISYAKSVQKIIIATTKKKEDDVIVNKVKECKIDFFRGSEFDVLDRYYKCAKKFSIKEIIRITCDNPLIDPTIIDRVEKEFRIGKNDYVTNSLPRTFPQGTEVEVFSFDVLKKIWSEAEKKSEREHVTPYIYNNNEKFKIRNISYSENLSHLRWTVDKKNDLEFVRTISKKIKKRPILMKDILDLLKKEPNLIEINSDYIMNESYLKSLEEDKS